jgi:hypothetical protein
LLNEPRTARADGETDADFLLAPRRAGEEHAGNIRAGNQQDEADDEHESERDRANRPIRNRMNVNVLGRQRADIEALVRLLVGGLQTLADERHVRGRGVVGRAGFQPAFDEHPSRAPALEARGAGRRHRADDAARLDLVDVSHRRPHLRCQERHHAGERRRRDANDRVRLAVDSDRLADGRRAGGVFTIPQPIGDHCRARRARLVVFRQQRAADKRLHAEQLKVVAGHRLAHRKPRAVDQFHGGHRRAVGQHVGEHVVLRFEIEEVRIRAGRVAIAVAAAGEHVDQPVRALDRQRLEQQGVDQREQRGVEADADGQRRDGDQSERRAAAQPAKRETDVGQEVFEHG